MTFTSTLRNLGIAGLIAASLVSAGCSKRASLEDFGITQAKPAVNFTKAETPAIPALNFNARDLASRTHRTVVYDYQDIKGSDKDDIVGIRFYDVRQNGSQDTLYGNVIFEYNKEDSSYTEWICWNTDGLSPNIYTHKGPSVKEYLRAATGITDPDIINTYALAKNAADTRLQEERYGR